MSAPEVQIVYRQQKKIYNSQIPPAMEIDSGMDLSQYERIQGIDNGQ